MIKELFYSHAFIKFLPFPCSSYHSWLLSHRKQQSTQENSLDDGGESLTVTGWGGLGSAGGALKIDKIILQDVRSLPLLYLWQPSKNGRFYAVLGSSWKLGGAAEHLIDGSKKRGWELESACYWKAQQIVGLRLDWIAAVSSDCTLPAWPETTVGCRSG